MSPDQLVACYVLIRMALGFIALFAVAAWFAWAFFKGKDDEK